MTSIQELLDQSKKIATEKPEISFELATEAYDLSILQNAPKFTAQALFSMAYACRVKSDYSKALSYGVESLEIYKSLNDYKGMLRSSNIIGIIYFYYGAYQEALDFFLKAIEYIEFQEDPNLESSLYNNIGEVYRLAKDYDKALTYYYKGVNICNQNALESNKAVIFLNIGEVYYQMAHYDDSYDMIKKSYDIVMQSNDLINQGEAETKLGRALLMKGHTDDAKQYFDSAKSKLMHINNKFYLVEVLIEMARLDELTGTNPLKNWTEALTIAQENRLDNKISAVYEALSRYHESLGDYDKSLTYFKAFHIKEKENEALNLSKRLEVLTLEHAHDRERNSKSQIEELTKKLEKDMLDTKSELNALMELNSTLMNDILIDDLTQLFNRRGLEKNFNKLFKNDVAVSGTVLLIDIDRFKDYNDSLGHVQGDHCLRMLSATLKSFLPNGAFIGRYGGEEFLSYLPTTTKSKAIEIANLMRLKIESLEIDSIYGTEPSKVTISIGGYVGLIASETLDNVIHQADMELYKAKENGRNQVMLHEAHPK